MITGPVGGTSWRLAPGLDDTLRRLAERGDIVRTMQREFTRRGMDRASADQAIYDPSAPHARPLVGRLIGRGLADEHASFDGGGGFVPAGGEGEPSGGA